MRRVLLAALLLGCQREAAQAPGRFPVPLVAAAKAGDAVVATVDGRPIHASDVALQAKAAGSDTKRALSDLIDAEVLAGEAARRGLDRDPDAQEAARATAVLQFLAQSYEKEVTPASIPDGALHQVYERNRPTLDHDEEIDVWHILVPTRGLTPEQKQAARATAEKLAKQARGLTLEQFKALAQTLPNGRPEHVVTERDGWTEKPFSYAAFDQLKKPGDTSGVVETSYGYHVIYLVTYHPAVHIRYADAEAELRKNFFPEWRKPEFLHWLDRVAGSHAIETHPERLK